MGRLVAKQWASDAPYEARMEHPEMWTFTYEGNFIEPSYSGIPQVKWDDSYGDDVPVNEISIEYLRHIKAKGVSTVLEVTLEDGETFRTHKIQDGGRREFRCYEAESGEERKFGTLDYERIEVVKEE